MFLALLRIYLRALGPTSMGNNLGLEENGLRRDVVRLLRWSKTDVIQYLKKRPVHWNGYTV